MTPIALPGWRTVAAAGAIAMAAAVIAGAGVRQGRWRLRAVMPGRRPARRRPAVATAPMLAVLAGLVVFLALPGLPGMVLAVAVGAAVDRGARRLEPAARRRAREDSRAALPFAADLLAATLRAGAPIAAALHAVGHAIGGALGTRLRDAGALHALGAPPAEAWATVLELPDAAPLVRAAIRAGDSGAALAGAAERLAGQLRAGSDAAFQATARRAEVLALLPLAVCYLPAFVLVGVVPVVLGVLRAVLG